MRNRGIAISFYTRARNPGNRTLFDINFLFEMLIRPQPARLIGDVDDEQFLLLIQNNLCKDTRATQPTNALSTTYFFSPSF